jgi:hypothetical protein
MSDNKRRGGRRAQ